MTQNVIWWKIDRRSKCMIIQRNIWRYDNISKFVETARRKRVFQLFVLCIAEIFAPKIYFVFREYINRNTFNYRTVLMTIPNIVCKIKLSPSFVAKFKVIYCFHLTMVTGILYNRKIVFANGIQQKKTFVV